MSLRQSIAQPLESFLRDEKGETLTRRRPLFKPPCWVGSLGRRLLSDSKMLVSLKSLMLVICGEFVFSTFWICQYVKLSLGSSNIQSR